LGKYGAEAFTYDADGNRLSATEKGRTSTYTYLATSNQLTSISGDEPHNFTYDARGNTIEDSSMKFTYDSRNRNSAIDMHDDHGFGSVKYTYNALGERVSKDDEGSGPDLRRGRAHDNDRDRDDHDSKHKHFIYDEQGHLIAETKDDGNNSREYVYLNDLPIVEVDGQEVYYIHTDHLGTPQKMTDDHQKIVWERVAEPFGETVSIEGPAVLNLRFPGQYHDAESGLDQNGFRSYSTELGRYPQSDMIGLRGGINSYGYVGQNPVNNVDPMGLESLILEPKNDPAYPADQSYNNSNYYTVGTHGYEPNDPDNVLGPNGKPMSVSDLGNAILDKNNQSPWDRKQPIQLEVCKAGAGGDSSFAAQLSQYLAEQTGNVVTVSASPDDVTLYSLSPFNYYIYTIAYPGRGGWQSFTRSPKQ